MIFNKILINVLRYKGCGMIFSCQIFRNSFRRLFFQVFVFVVEFVFRKLRSLFIFLCIQRSLFVLCVFISMWISKFIILFIKIQYLLEKVAWQSIKSVCFGVRDLNVKVVWYLVYAWFVDKSFFFFSCFGFFVSDIWNVMFYWWDCCENWN